MNIQPVDERDSGWEDHDPRFRVYLFEESAPVDGPDGSSRQGYTTGTWDIVDADLLEVVRWAQDQAGVRGLYSIALVADRYGSNDERGLVWLVGEDYQDTPADDRSHQVQARMRSRRGRAIVGPA
jgi:hypothetical protein